MAQIVKNIQQCRRPGFDPWVGKILWRRARQSTPDFFFFSFFHSRFLAWRIPWTEEPVELQSIRLQRVRHDGSDLAQGISSFIPFLCTISTNDKHFRKKNPITTRKILIGLLGVKKKKKRFSLPSRFM